MKFGGFERIAPAVWIAGTLLILIAAAQTTYAASDTDTGPAASAVAPVSSDVWFPQNSDDALVHPLPVRTAQAPGSLLPRERPLIPLPAAAWTGLMGLSGVAAFVGRKALLRFVS
jgi:hypothetical protein